MAQNKVYTFSELNDMYKATTIIDTEINCSNELKYFNRREKNIKTLIKMRKELTGVVSRLVSDKEIKFLTLTKEEISSEIYLLQKILNVRLDKARVKKSEMKILNNLMNIISYTQENKLSKNNRETTNKHIEYLIWVRNSISSNVEMEDFPFIRWNNYTNTPPIKSDFFN